ncbi:MAG: VWA domain-containing protein [Myxococcales bacterium]|nr:VWA domain-containing protein [Myxococcales bacterium]
MVGSWQSHVSSHKRGLRLVPWIVGLLCMAWVDSALAVVPRCPNLAILLDQSASMNDNPQGMLESDRSKTKWAIATATLTTLNNNLNGRLPLAYTNFPRYDGSCVPYETFRVPLGSSNKTEINNAMIEYPFKAGTTPMCTAISKLADEMAFKDPQRPHYILLLTDGVPDAACCGVDPVQATINAIGAAIAQSPPVKTIVVGFGNLPASDRDALNRMAVAGGLPKQGTNKFYEATDAASLNTVLNTILRTLVVGDAGAGVLCEDGCYGTPCPTGEVCLQDACKANPCTSQQCPNGQACLFTAQGASCVGTCKSPCPLKSRCENGLCVPDPCGGPCPSGQQCLNGACQPDPRCDALLCHGGQGCIEGKCVDNPCSYTTCPEGTECVDFTGMCMAPRPPGFDQTGGCQCKVSSDSPAGLLGPLSALLLLTWLVRRRLRASS